MCIYISVCANNLNVYIHAHIHINVLKRPYMLAKSGGPLASTCVRTQLYICICRHVYIYIIQVYIYMCIYIHTPPYICVGNVYIYIHAGDVCCDVYINNEWNNHHVIASDPKPRLAGVVSCFGDEASGACAIFGSAA